MGGSSLVRSRGDWGGGRSEIVRGLVRGEIHDSGGGGSAPIADTTNIFDWPGSRTRLSRTMMW